MAQRKVHTSNLTAGFLPSLWRESSILAVLVLSLTCYSGAQVDTGTVSGQVLDQSGAVIPGAELDLINQATGVIAKTVSNGTGNYAFPATHPGIYNLAAQAKGFGKQIRQELVVQVQQGVVVNFTLTPGQLTQSVNVSSMQPVMQTQNASVGQVIGARSIQSLPLNGRNYTFLARLAAGVVVGQQSRRGEDQHGRFSANGVRPTENSYLLDGMDNNSSIISRTNGKDYVILTPVDGLAEFKVQTSDYSAEFGRAAGAVLNAVTKSGSNAIHGDAWEFFRNDKLDADDYFQNPKIPKGELRLNQFGFTLGGPVTIPHVYSGRNRTFFFVDYEGLRLNTGQTKVATVPTAAERASGYTDFSELISGQSGSTTDALGRTFPLGTIFDPTTTRAVGKTFVRDPFPDNHIPVNRIDPNAIKLLNILPEPTGPGILDNYNTTVLTTDHYNNFDIRVDEVFSPSDRMFARYSGNYEETNGGLFTSAFTGFASTNQDLNDHSQNAIFVETHTFGPSMVNVFRIGINREAAIWQQDFANQTGIPEQFGIVGIQQIPGNGGLPYFNSIGQLSAFGGGGQYVPARKYGTTPQVTDDLTVIHGNHTLKFGFTGQRIAYPFTQPPFSRGTLGYSGVFTSVINHTDGSTGIAQFLLDPPTNGGFGFNSINLSGFQSHDLLNYYWGIYGQDDWKVLPKLTLNLGLRWDYYTFPFDGQDNNANFVPGAGFKGGTYYIPRSRVGLLGENFLSAVKTDGITVQPTGHELGTTQKGNFAPRIGVAYQVTPKLVARAGYGIFYDGFEQIGGSPLLTENYPFEFIIHYVNLTPHTPITPDGSIGSLEQSYQTISLNPSSVAPAGIEMVGYQPHWSTMYSQDFNLSLEYELAGNTALTLAYVGSTSRHIPVILGGNPVLTMLPPGTNATPYRPYPNLSTTADQILNNAASNFNSFQVTVEHRYSNGFDLLGNFAWQKALTDARDPLENDIGGYRGAFFPGFGIQADYGLADFDVRRVAHFSGLYDLPFGRGKMLGANSKGVVQGLIGGWTLAGDMTLSDGNPFTVACPVATSATLGCNALLTGKDRYAGSSVSHFLNAAAFATPAPVTAIGQTGFASAGWGPTQVSGPPLRRADLALMKQIPIHDRFRGEFRAEAFNVSNTPWFSLPGSLDYRNTAAFARITSTRDSPNDPREFQFAVKLFW